VRQKVAFVLGVKDPLRSHGAGVHDYATECREGGDRVDEQAHDNQQKNQGIETKRKEYEEE
jgi:hypothetical protein